MSIFVKKSRKSTVSQGILRVQNNNKGERKMSVKKINQQEFENAKRNEGLLLLDFYADWCGPCKMVAPVVEEIAELRGDVFVAKINVDEEEALARSLGIVSIPTLMVFRDGKLHKQAVGFRSKEELLRLLEG